MAIGRRPKRVLGRHEAVWPVLSEVSGAARHHVVVVQGCLMSEACLELKVCSRVKLVVKHS